MYTLNFWRVSLNLTPFPPFRRITAVAPFSRPPHPSVVDFSLRSATHVNFCLAISASVLTSSPFVITKYFVRKMPLKRNLSFLCSSQMNGMMVSGVHIKVVLARRQTNMGDSHFRSRPGLGSRGKCRMEKSTIR